MAADRQCALRIEITPGYDRVSYAILWAAAVAAEEMCVLGGGLGFAIGLGTWICADLLLLMMDSSEYRFTVARCRCAGLSMQICSYVNNVAAMTRGFTPLIPNFRRSSENFAGFPETFCGYGIQYIQRHHGNGGKQSHALLNSI